MNGLHDWLSRQHHGLRTFQLFRQKLAKLTIDDPANAALYTLLGMLVARYIEAFDEEPVPISVADRAFGNLLRVVAGLDFSESAEGRLIDLNRIATLDLLDPSLDVDCHRPRGSLSRESGTDGVHRPN